MSNKVNHSDGGVRSVHIALDVLDIVAKAQQEVGVSEIAASLGLAKASIFRHTRTLVERGFLIQNPSTARYGLGMKLHVLGTAAYNRIDLLSVSRPIMMKLRDETSLTIHLASFTEAGVVVVESIHGTAVMEIALRVGTEFPFHATSQGRVGMAFRADIAEAVKGQTRQQVTPSTITDWSKLEEIVALVRKDGYSLVLGETIMSTYGFSVPIFDMSEQCVAALTLVGSVQFPPKDSYRLAIAEAGKRISSALGYFGKYPGLE